MVAGVSAAGRAAVAASARSAVEKRRGKRMVEVRAAKRKADAGSGSVSRRDGNAKKIRPRNLAVPGPNLGVGVRHALFPGHTRLGALAFAGGVLPDATLRGRRRVRSHGGTVLTVAGRDFSSEASAPGSVAPCRGRLAGRGADTSAIPSSRVGTVATGTAPAGGWPLAPRYGSDLLPLRLPLLLQRGDVVFHAAPSRRFHGLCQVRSLPAAAPSFRARFASEAGLLAGWARRMTRLRSGLRSSNQNPLGHCVGARVETSRGPDSARAWFLITPNRSTPDFV